LGYHGCYKDLFHLDLSVELLPFQAAGYETVLNSERIVRECLVGITMRKKGITDEAYFAPLTVDDSRK